MRRIANYFKQVLCKHNFITDETSIVQVSENMLGQTQRKAGIRVSATCTKCGYHKSYWKYY